MVGTICLSERGKISTYYVSVGTGHTQSAIGKNACRSVIQCMAHCILNSPDALGA